MKVLVTGGAGFIGSHIVEHFQGKAEIRVLDNLRSGYRKNLDGLKCEFIEGSILDRALVKKAVQGVDFIFHLAAMISVPESMDKPLECVEMNVDGLLNMLEEGSAAGVKKLCLSSSAACYGDNPISPKVETLAPEPKSPYAITKLDGEYYCRMFHDGGKIQTVALRYFNVFGPRQDPKSQYAAAVPIFIDKAVRNQTLKIFGDGTQTRDFIYVKDIAAANAYFCTESTATGVYNVAYGQKMSITELAQMILRLTGSKATVEYLPERPGDIKHSLAAIDKIRQAGFQPSGRLDEGLKHTIQYFQGLSR